MKNADLNCPIPIAEHETIQLAHGGGGRMMHNLIEHVFLSSFQSPELAQLVDSATLSLGREKVAFSTDCYVVDPLFFPGGDIGELAVNGTVNDVCMSGATPVCLSIGLILEEGFSLKELKKITLSVRRAADSAGVRIVAGDTKVVNRGKADKLFINTAGIGVFSNSCNVSPSRIEPGDKILLSGTIADHGIAVLTSREELGFEAKIESDTAPLHELVASMVEVGGSAIHALRDPTRGGVASVLNEFAEAAQVEIRIREDRISLKPAVAGACEILGLDPLYVANEGKLIASVAADKADLVVQAMRDHPLGREAAVVGEVTEGRPGLVSMKTRIGGWRVVDMLVGEQLPRIC
jgi:hydrogenase expression/formation protein HypE